MGETRLLAVDDDRISLTLLTNALRGLGTVATARNGHDALQQLDSGPLPDLILLDAEMPEMDGFEVFDRFKASDRLNSIPVIFVTGHADRETETRVLEAGAVDFITKPISAPVVRARVITQIRLLDLHRSMHQANQLLLERLTAQNSNIESLLNLIPDPIWLKDDHGYYLIANPAALRVFGHDKDNVIGRSDRELFSADVASALEAQDKAVTSAGKQCTFEFETRSSRSGRVTLWDITQTPINGGNGELQGIIGVARDITRRRESELQLRKLSKAVEQNPNPIIITDAKTHIEYVNEAFTRITGYTTEYVIGLKAGFNRSGKTPPAVFNDMWSQLSSGKPWKGRLVNRNRDGAEMIVFAHIAPIRDASGVITHYLAIQEDITERVRLADEIDRSHEARRAAEAASEAKSSFLANMSHEIRTPLNAIIGLTHLMRHEQPTELQNDRLIKIYGAAEHLLSLVNDILDISKIEAGRFELAPTAFRLAEVIRNVSALMAERLKSKGLMFSAYVSELPPILHGDSMRLTQILLNYIGNAIKFTPSGSITLLGLPVEETEHEVLARFTVQDTGIGISHDQQAALFQAFVQADSSTTRKFGGTGLGLKINRHLAQLMGGEAGMTSTVGVGSAFWVTVRLGKPDAEELPESDHSASADEIMAALAQRCRGAAILLVEDNPINQEVSLTLLRNIGISADLAEDGKQAVLAAENKLYDLVLMDMQLPEMNGLDATRSIRCLAAYARTPIIAMTANAFNEDRQDCLAAGMNDHISKPVDPHALYSMLLKWLPDNKLDVSAEEADPSKVAMPDIHPGSTAIPAIESALTHVAGLDYAVGLKQMSGNVQVYENLLRHFAASIDAEMNNLKAGIESGDLEKARRLAHSLKGSAGTLGATSVFESAGSLESALRGRESANEINAGFDRLVASFREFANAISVV